MISGADISFYEGDEMEYCSMSLFGEKCYAGKYEMVKDTFFVTYKNGFPNIESEKMIRKGDLLLFLDAGGELVYRFYLDRRFVE